MNQQWNKIERQQLPHIKKNDFWVYAREYLSGTGYQGGPTNSLVLDFKKSPSKKQTIEHEYRKKAIYEFKKEIEMLLNPKIPAVLTSVPSSKKKDHPEYDNRFEDLFKEILKSHPHWMVEWPVEIKTTTLPAHISGKRDPDTLKKNYIWKGFNHKEPKILYIFDDIITTGAHLRALSDFFSENGYKGKIIGICWAKTVQKREGF